MALVLTTTDRGHPSLLLRAAKADAYARSIAVGERCNAAAAKAGYLELTLPSADVLRATLEKPGGLIVTAAEGPTPVGLMVISDARKPPNTGYVTWLFVDAQRAAEISVAMADAAIAVRDWDWMWGRIAHTGMHDSILKAPRVKERSGDPAVLEFPR